MSRDEKFVIFASSLGTVFEWYDFYLYATLAPFFAALFFPPGNDTAALLSAFATYAAGFLVRPFGAIIFGRIGDLVGRKYTFLVTIVVMGGATFLVGLLPTFQTIGWAAPLPAGNAAARAGPRARRRIRRCCNLCGRACAAT
jgi:MFS family permease